MSGEEEREEPMMVPRTLPSAERSGEECGRGEFDMSGVGAETLGRQLEGRVWSQEKGPIAVFNPFKAVKRRSSENSALFPQG